MHDDDASLSRVCTIVVGEEEEEWTWTMRPEPERIRTGGKEMVYTSCAQTTARSEGWGWEGVLDMINA